MAENRRSRVPRRTRRFNNLCKAGSDTAPGFASWCVRIPASGMGLGVKESDLGRRIQTAAQSPIAARPALPDEIPLPVLYNQYV